LTNKKIFHYPVSWLLPILIFIYLNSGFLLELSKVPYAIVLEISLVVIVFRVIYWIDAYEPEPKIAMTWTILAASSFSILITDTVYLSLDDSNIGMLQVGVIEELAKAIVLVPIFKSDLIHSWVDGCVYGALIGLGFSISEDIAYAASDPDAVGTILFRGTHSIFAHSLFTGIIGASVAFVILNKNRFGLILAALGVFAHFAWNEYIINIPDSYFVLVSFATPLLFVGLAFQLRTIEHRKIIQIANQMIENQEIENHQFNLITNLSYRKAFRRKHKTFKSRRIFDREINELINGRI